MFLAFFFFGALLPPNVFVAAHRIVWYGRDAIWGASVLDAASGSVVSLPRGAINDRGCAIVLQRDREAVVILSKVHRSFGRAKTG